MSGHQRSKIVHLGSPEVKKQISQEFPRSSCKVTRGQKAKFLQKSQDRHFGSPEIREQNIQRIPEISVWGHQRSKSKISKECPRSSAWGHQRSKSKLSKIPTTGKESLSLWAFWFPVVAHWLVFPTPLLMLSTKHNGSRLHFLSLWYDPACSWTPNPSTARRML